MNYKKLIKSRAAREKILRVLDFVPSKPMLKAQYYIKTGRRLDIKKPKRFTEKLQWMKLYYRDPLMVQCVDKYEVRQYIESLGLGDTLVKCLGVFDCAADVDFDVLPEKFVIKDTLGTGGNAVIVCTDKSRLDVAQVRQQMDSWIRIDNRKRDGGREWPYYSGKKHRIYIEEYLESNVKKGGLIDYKFFCFYGKTACLYVMRDRAVSLTAGIYDRDFKKINAYISYDRKMLSEAQKPVGFERMRTIAELISSRFPHARVDLYNLEGKIYFGEITFFDGSGYTTYDPDEFDLELGNQFRLPDRNA